MLKEQDIFVRSHLSPLKPEQVALMRARWEREKRKLKEAPAPPKRRRAVKAAAEPGARRRRPAPAGGLRGPRRGPARRAATRQGEEAQEGEEVAGGPGGRGAEHLAYPRLDQRAGGAQGRTPPRGRSQLPRR